MDCWDVLSKFCAVLDKARPVAVRAFAEARDALKQLDNSASTEAQLRKHQKALDDLWIAAVYADIRPSDDPNAPDSVKSAVTGTKKWRNLDITGRSISCIRRIQGCWGQDFFQKTRTRTLAITLPCNPSVNFLETLAQVASKETLSQFLSGFSHFLANHTTTQVTDKPKPQAASSKPITQANLKSYLNYNDTPEEYRVFCQPPPGRRRTRRTVSVLPVEQPRRAQTPDLTENSFELDAHESYSASPPSPQRNIGFHGQLELNDADATHHTVTDLGLSPVDSTFVGMAKRKRSFSAVPTVPDSSPLPKRARSLSVSMDSPVFGAFMKRSKIDLPEPQVDAHTAGSQDSFQRDSMSLLPTPKDSPKSVGPMQPSETDIREEKEYTGSGEIFMATSDAIQTNTAGVRIPSVTNDKDPCTGTDGLRSSMADAERPPYDHQRPRATEFQSGDLSGESTMADLAPRKWLTSQTVTQILADFIPDTDTYMHYDPGNIEHGMDATPIRQNRLARVNNVLVPLCRNSHWFLLRYDLREQSAKVYDSRLGVYVNDDTRKDLIRRVGTAVSKAGAPVAPVFWAPFTVEVTEQLNDWDCGVFTLVHAFYVAAGACPPRVNAGLWRMLLRMFYRRHFGDDQIAGLLRELLDIKSALPKLPSEPSPLAALKRTMTSSQKLSKDLEAVEDLTKSLVTQALEREDRTTQKLTNMASGYRAQIAGLEEIHNAYTRMEFVGSDEQEATKIHVQRMSKVRQLHEKARRDPERNLKKTQHSIDNLSQFSTLVAAFRTNLTLFHSGLLQKKPALIASSKKALEEKTLEVQALRKEIEELERLSDALTDDGLKE